MIAKNIKVTKATESLWNSSRLKEASKTGQLGTTRAPGLTLFADITETAAESRMETLVKEYMEFFTLFLQLFCKLEMVSK